MRTPRWRMLLAVLAVLALVAAACGDDDADDGPPDDAPPTEDDGDPAAIPDGPTIRIRAQDFPESVTINQVYAQYLEGLGYPVSIADPLGFRDAFIEALQASELDMTVDYIGGSFAQLSDGAVDIDQSDPDAVLAAIRDLYGEFGVAVLDYAPAVNGDALVVRQADAAENGWTTISDLAPDTPGLRFGASEQCFTRPQCLPGLEEVYGFAVPEANQSQIEYGSALGTALAENEIDVTMWEDTAPQIERDGFVILEDDLGLFPVQNIAPVVEESVVDAYGDAFVDALDGLSARITTDDLRAWNERTSIDFDDPADVARDWLQAQGLI